MKMKTNVKSGTDSGCGCGCDGPTLVIKADVDAKVVVKL